MYVLVTHTIWCNEFRTPFNFRLHVFESTVEWQSGSAPLFDVKQTRSTSSSSTENIAQFTAKSHYVAKSSFGFSTIFIVRGLDLLSALRIDGTKKPWSPWPSSTRIVNLWITTMQNEIFPLCLYVVCAREGLATFDRDACMNSLESLFCNSIQTTCQPTTALAKKVESFSLITTIYPGSHSSSWAYE